MKPQPDNVDAPAASLKPVGSATDIAHKWLKKQCEDVNGHISTWPTDTMDRYHRDLGLLVDFVTDCWPNAERSESPQ